MKLKKMVSMRTVETYAICACAYAICSCKGGCSCICDSPVANELQRSGLTNVASANQAPASNYAAGNIVYGTV